MSTTDERISRYLSRRAMLGGFAATAGAAILAACGSGSSPTSTPANAATQVSNAATRVGPTVQAAATGAAPTVNAAVTQAVGAATSAAPTVNAAASSASGAATSAAPTVAAAGTAVSSAAAAGPYTGKKLNVALVLNGTLGDKSFFDSAQRGMDRAKTELGMTVKTIELGYDENKWGPGLADAASQNYDVIICGTFNMEQYITETAAKATTKKFVFFDDAVDYKKGFTNVYSVMFKQNEGSYLAGFMAGMLVQSTNADVVKGTGGGKKIGFLGGSNIPVINDFLAGWKQGAKDAGLKDADILVSYVEGQTPFADPAKGKELRSRCTTRARGSPSTSRVPPALVCWTRAARRSASPSAWTPTSGSSSRTPSRISRSGSRPPCRSGSITRSIARYG